MKHISTLVLVLALFCVGIVTTATGADMKTIKMRTLTPDEVQNDLQKSRVSLMVLKRQPIFTLERPWIPNIAAPDGVGGGTPNVSSVPLGDYDLVLRDSPARGEQWHLVNHDLHVFLEKDERQYAWQRYSCMFHGLNYVYQSGGCIGPGFGLRDMDGDGVVDVTSSQAALLKIKTYLDGEKVARLRII